MAWSFARLLCVDLPLFAAISSSAITLGNRLEDRNASMLPWALGKADPTLGLAFLESRREFQREFDGVGLGSLFSACLRHGLRVEAARVAAVLGFDAATNFAAMVLAEAGLAEEALQIQHRGRHDAVSQRLLAALGEGNLDLSRGECSVPRAYAKEQELLLYALSHSRAGSAESACAAVESFASLLPGSRRWLKVFAGVKGDLLTDMASMAPPGLALEVGTYCGYSAARIATARRFVERQPYSPVLLTVEVDLAHAAIAQSFLVHAGLLHLVQIRIGHSEDVLHEFPSSEDCLFMPDKSRLSLVFLDQRGSRYGTDLGCLEEKKLLTDGAVIVADNVLKPGAPLFLWSMVHSNVFFTEIISVPEFAMETEDWVSVSTKRRTTGTHLFTQHPAPEQFAVLEWESDQMRRRSHAPDTGGRGIDFAEWAMFAEDLRCKLGTLGICATPL